MAGVLAEWPGQEAAQVDLQTGMTVRRVVEVHRVAVEARMQLKLWSQVAAGGVIMEVEGEAAMFFMKQIQ